MYFVMAEFPTDVVFNCILIVRRMGNDLFHYRVLSFALFSLAQTVIADHNEETAPRHHSAVSRKYRNVYVAKTKSY